MCAVEDIGKLGAQFEQAVAPFDALYPLLVHALHTLAFVALVVAENVPAKQLVHAAFAVPAEYLPASQSVHDVWLEPE